MMNHLSREELLSILDQFDPGEELSIERMRPHNKGEIRKTVKMNLKEFRDLVLSSAEKGHQPGGDLELIVPKLNKRLVGHHNGIYWLEDL
jgi:hypothetical protein